MTNQPCTSCGWTLRFIPERNGWGCDRCHAFVPQGAPMPTPSASPWAPPGGSAAVSPAVGHAGHASGPVTGPIAADPASGPVAAPYSPYAQSPYAPPPYGAPPPAPYVPQPQHPAPVPIPYPAQHPAGRPATNKRLWLVGAAAAAVIAIIVTIVVLTRSSGGVGSRQEIVNATIAALAAGDVNKLVALADPKSLFERVLDCSNSDDDDMTPKALEREFREKSERLADKVSGRRLEVISIESRKIDRDSGDGRGYGGRDSGVFKKGDKVFGGCRAREAFRAHEVMVTVEETRKGKKPRQKSVPLELLEVDGDWYLVDAPRGRADDEIPALGDDSDSDDMVEKMREFKDQMCRCTDRTCANRVTEAMTKWSTDVMKRDRDNDFAKKLSPKLEEITKQFSECMMKAMEN